MEEKVVTDRELAPGMYDDPFYPINSIEAMKVARQIQKEFRREFRKSRGAKIGAKRRWEIIRAAIYSHWAKHLPQDEERQARSLVTKALYELQHPQRNLPFGSPRKRERFQ